MHAYNPKYCVKIVELMAEGKSLAAFCAHIGISRQTAYDWRDAHPEFKEALSIAREKSQAVWESKGMQGIFGECEKFNASGYIFTMKNRFREDYSEEKEVKTVSDTIVEKLIDKLVD